MLRLNLVQSEPNLHTFSDDNFEKPAKRISDWVEILKAFTAKNKDRCCDMDEDVYLNKKKVEQYFMTGSKYKGKCDAFGINGQGTYTFPDGVIYDGEFKDGIFHGKGRMKFTCGTVLSGDWIQGLVVSPKVILQGELAYDENSHYCAMPDRRFCVERKRCIQPAGKSYLTNEQPPREIPNGYYDTGCGFYDPVCKDIVHYKDKFSILRAPAEEEQHWIEENCRVAPDRSVGPARKLYEQFAEIKENLYDEPVEYGMSGLMDFHNPELEDRLEASKRLLEKRLLPKTYTTAARRFTIRDIQQSRFL